MSTGKLLLAEEMKNVGFADPASACQTLQWAKMKGDTNVIFNAVAWGDERTGVGAGKVWFSGPVYVKSLDRFQPHEDRDMRVSSRSD